MRRLLTAALLGAALVLTGAACTPPPLGDPNPRPVDEEVQPVDDREDPVSVDRGSLDAATLSLRGSAQSISLGTDDPAAGLLVVRAETPDSRPGIDSDDDTQVVSLDGGAAFVRVARDVTWTVDVSAGAETVDADLRDVAVSGVALDGGARTIELRLPTPEGTVAVDQRAGAEELLVFLPDGVGARVTVTSGAGSVDIDGTATPGVGAGTVLTTDGFDEGTGHYEITVAGGLGSLTIDRS